jgi:ssDNA-binding Zn-finger/Zn-ribbon topoisomerase 1
VRLKHNVIEPEPEPEPEVPAELPVEEVKVDAKVKCPDCGKMMSQKTLRYSHGPNCVAKKQKTMTEDNLQSASDDWVEHEVQRRLYGRREERATRREAMVAKLVQNAF